MLKKGLGIDQKGLETVFLDQKKLSFWKREFGEIGGGGGLTPYAENILGGKLVGGLGGTLPPPSYLYGKKSTE